MNRLNPTKATPTATTRSSWRVGIGIARAEGIFPTRIQRAGPTSLDRRWAASASGVTRPLGIWRGFDDAPKPFLQRMSLPPMRSNKAMIAAIHELALQEGNRYHEMTVRFVDPALLRDGAKIEVLSKPRMRSGALDAVTSRRRQIERRDDGDSPRVY